mmetsp:Transcript_3530/g.7151  ORF Transcript_3530/g.7151 Transcript_3530/m.7151 type:complete len:341 (+) Transcript_3530:24-1046(+)
MSGLSESKKPKMVQYTTGYWSIKGLGAPLRMMLCYAGVSFESLCYDVKMDAETGKLDARSWFSPKKSLKTSNPFINLPYVVDESSGLVVSQTNACFSYLGRKLGLWGTTQEEVVMCETLLSEIMDLRNAMTKYAYNQDHDKVQEDGVELLDNVKGKNGIMQKFELHLGSVVGGFLLGGKVTAPDFHFYEMLDQYAFLSTFLGAGDFLSSFPNCRSYYENFKSHPKNRYYLSSDLNGMPFNNKKARFGSTPEGGRFVKGQDYSWKDAGGVYEGSSAPPVMVGGSKGLPPWWILNKVKPEGGEKDMGTWKAISFSKDQQEQFGVDEDGNVVNQTVFDNAINK